MYIIWPVVVVLLCNGVEMKKAGDRNDKWRNSDIIMNDIDEFYSNLPVYIEEDGDQQKRFYSVVSLAIYMYVKNDVTDDVRRAKEAVEKTRMQLYQPADVIASPMRTLLVFLQSVIQQPLTDVKASCLPNTTQTECDKNLNKTRHYNEQSCHGYHKNVELYDKLTDDKHANYRARVMRDLLRNRRGNDDQALVFFEKAATQTYKEFFSDMNKFYKVLLHGSFPCKFPLILMK